MKLLALVKKVQPNILNLGDEKNLEHLKLPVLVDMKTTDVILKVNYSFFRKVLFYHFFLGEIHFPKYSMGSRTKYRKCDAYPAANSYSLPQLIGPKIPSKPASNAYSMTSRRSIGSFDQDLARTPGAAR